MSTDQTTAQIRAAVIGIALWKVIAPSIEQLPWLGVTDYIVSVTAIIVVVVGCLRIVCNAVRGALEDLGR